MLKILLIGIFSLQGLFASLSALESNSARDEVVERLQQFTEAVNQGNLDDLSTYWTEDAEFARPATGEILEGEDEIIQFLAKATQEIKERKLQFKLQPGNIDFPDADTAVVQAVAEVTEKGALINRVARKIALLKQDGQWYIDSIREIEVPPPPPVYGHLKELEWLVGSWVDKDEDVTITFETKWDKFKNFIVQHFKMEVYGLEVMEGLQIIGWDPIESKIHSWVYDSDGGVGTGVWSKHGDSWWATLNYVLSDGKKGSATDIYTKINGKRYSFSSIDRRINGQAIPDIEPVTVVRKDY